MDRHPRKIFLIVTALTLLVFLIKGIHYSILRSYIPLIIVLSILTIIVIGFIYYNTLLKIAIRLWAVLLLLWSCLRIILSIFLFFNPINESHVVHELQGFGWLNSILFLLAGSYLYRKAKFYNKKYIHQSGEHK